MMLVPLIILNEKELKHRIDLFLFSTIVKKLDYYLKNVGLYQNNFK
jgi:hypothetical protein